MTTIVASARADLLRVRKWPAAWVTVGTWLVLTAVFGYLFNYVSYRSGNENFASEGITADQLLASVLPQSVPGVIIGGTPMFGGALMMVFGAIVAGSGYGWGSWKTVFTQGPSRTAVTVGSMLALTAVVVATVLATVVLAFAISSGIALVEGEEFVLPTASALLEGMGTGFLVLEMWGLLGFLLGTLARGPALAVGLGLVWSLVVENLLRGVGSLLDWVEAFTHVLPGTAAGSLVGSITGVGGPDAAPGVLDTLTGTQALVSMLAYVVLLPLVTVLVVRRRDVT
jgi:ABC-2 type transport system permease protein